MPVVIAELDMKRKTIDEKKEGGSTPRGCFTSRCYLDRRDSRGLGCVRLFQVNVIKMVVMK